MSARPIRVLLYGDLNLNIIDLGLVYNITVDEANKVIVDMSLTSPGCPAGPQIMHDVERTIQSMPGAGKVVINLVWEPYWTPERIEPKVRASSSSIRRLRRYPSAATWSSRAPEP